MEEQPFRTRRWKRGHLAGWREAVAFFGENITSNKTNNAVVAEANQKLVQLEQELDA